MTFSGIKRAVVLTPIFCGYFLLFQAVPESIYWLVFGTWYGLDGKTILPVDLLNTLTSTPLLGLNKLVLYLSDIWVLGAISLAFAFAMASVVIFSKYDDAEDTHDTLNSVLRKVELLNQAIEVLSEKLENELIELKDRIEIIEERVTDGSISDVD